MTYVDQYYLDNGNKVYFMSAQDQEDAIENNLPYPNPQWVPISKEEADAISNPPLNKQQTIYLYEQAAQANLDAIAQSWGYNNMNTAVTYANSTNPQFKADAETLIPWRDNYWLEAYTIEAGTLPATAEDFVGILPVAPIKPVI